MSFLSLPPELLLMVAEYLTLQQLILLLSSNRHLKSFFTPLRNKIAVQPKGNPPNPALIWATLENHEPLVHLLLSPLVSKRYDIDVNIRNASQDAALHIAAALGHESIARLLLENDADMNILDRRGCTPLLIAVSSKGSEAVACLLLEMGADPTIDDVLYQTSKNCNDEVIALLLNKLLLSSESVSSMKPWWSKNSFVDGKLALTLAASVGHVNMVKYLLEMGFDVDTSVRNEGTPLHYASEAGHEGVVRLLLDWRADFDARDDTGWTPLHFAARSGFVDIIRLLLERGADVNALNECGISALHWAAQNPSEKAVWMVELLLEKGADVQAQNGFAEETPLEWAFEFGKNKRVISILLSREGIIREVGGHEHPEIRSLELFEECCSCCQRYRPNVYLEDVSDS